MRRRDEGAAVVEFVLVGVLLVILLFAVLQVALFCYARNIVSASAADAARYAASAGVSPDAGADRARRLIAAGLNDAEAAAIPCVGTTGVDAASGLPVTRVRCHGRLRPVFLPLHLPLTIDVTASSLKEGAP